MPALDFHHASLLAHEQREASCLYPAPIRTWYVRTSVWEQQAISSDELVDLIDEALEAGLTPSIELC